MSELPADAWVPVPLRWRHVAPGDVFVGRDGRLWHVRAMNVLGRGIVSTDHGGENFAAPVDPDEIVQVLIPVTERDAVELCRDELGARLADRRSVEQRSTSQQTI